MVSYSTLIHIFVRVIYTNLKHYLSSVYFVNKPLYVSGIFGKKPSYTNHSYIFLEELNKRKTPEGRRTHETFEIRKRDVSNANLEQPAMLPFPKNVEVVTGRTDMSVKL